MGITISQLPGRRRMAVLAHALWVIEEMTKKKQNEPVLDSFLMI